MSELLQAPTGNPTCLACLYHRHVDRPLLPIITQWSSFAMLHPPDQATSPSQSTGHRSTGQYRMAAPHRPNQDAGPLRYQAPLRIFEDGIDMALEALSTEDGRQRNY
ncbi:hypothetical protein BKA70DRAFT_1448766 [Coprinopsis sp. MPI-PUGE-AT-0042]|nr:hypothetical protein BKA70DRAFT_1448766 [Coprinopsis sp. MPI-PUGE-AT-0042]